MRQVEAPPYPDFGRNQLAALAVYTPTIRWRPNVDSQTKHEILIIVLSTLAALPVMAGLGFVALDRHVNLQERSPWQKRL